MGTDAHSLAVRLNVLQEIRETVSELKLLTEREKRLLATIDDVSKKKQDLLGS